MVVAKKKPAGLKVSAIGHDGTKDAKISVIKKVIDTLKQPGKYIEVSGKLVDVMNNAGIKPVDDEKTVRAVLKGKDITWLGDGKYSRNIGGLTVTKQMFGRPKVTSQKNEASYAGNMGFHEMYLFYQKASDSQINQLESLMAAGKTNAA